MTQVPQDGMRQTQVVTLDDEAIVDVRAAANFLGYIGRSCRRRRGRLLSVAAITFALVSTMAMLTPFSYRIEMKILTHKSAVMKALVHPDMAIPQSADSPTGGVIELVKSDTNIEGLLSDTDLIRRWEKKRPVLNRFKDRMLAPLVGKPKPEDLQKAYMTMLEEKIDAHVEGEVIYLSVEWNDAETAMLLAENTIARFLKMRHDMELAEILETVSILGRNVEASRMGIEAVVKRMQKIFEDREADLQVKAGTPRSESHRRVHKSRFVSIRKPVAAEAPDPASTSLRAQFAQKNSAFAMMKKAYEDRLRDAEQRLANLRASLGPDHPDVGEAKRALDQISKQPPELTALEADQSKLAGQVGSLPTPREAKPVLVVDPAPHESEEQKFDMVRVPVSEDLYKEMDKDPEIAAVMDELKKRQDSHDDLVRRLANARIESETANAAFNYRYVITKHPLMPETPVKPNRPLLIVGGAVVALILGVLLALLSDILSGLLIEAWQVERFLGVKLLGEVEEP